MTTNCGYCLFSTSKSIIMDSSGSTKAQMKMMIYISPIMIVIISISSMAALPLYWSVGGLLLIVQTYIGRKYYSDIPR